MIEVEEFVCAGDIDPVMFDKTYYLGSQDKGKDAYRLLHDALAKTGRAGIGRWVFHNREYLVAVRALRGRARRMHTMRFHDELVAADDLDIPHAVAQPERPRAEDGRPARRDAARRSSTRRSSRTPTASACSSTSRPRRRASSTSCRSAPRPPDPDDLMAALEASLGGGSAERRWRARCGPGR